MKNYKQILEAINRGIKFALDDFEDQEDIQGQTNSKVKYKGGIKELIDLKKITVDLGLPSGTLWCKYNLGVDENKLTYNPDSWYGKYYQWGETYPERLCNWLSYEHANGDWNMLTKYCNDPDYWGLDTPVDNLTRLKDNDDAAYQNMHCHDFKFHIPTREQFKELIEYTDQRQVKDYGDVPGLNGKVFISKINKQKIFFPFAGFINDGEKGCEGSFGYYWSSDLSRDEGSNFVCYFNVYDNDVDLPEDGSRENGFTIRPVCNL